MAGLMWPGSLPLMIIDELVNLLFKTKDKKRRAFLASQTNISFVDPRPFTSEDAVPQDKLKFLRKENHTVPDSRKHGEKIRQDFLHRLENKGIFLQLSMGKTIYRTKSGKRVGIAVATERQQNRWFLGLPAGGYDHAVLLCQREDGDIIEILLTDKFLLKYGIFMSTSNGQVLFNIVQRDSTVLILVPRTGGVSVSSFSNDYSCLL